MGGTAWCDARRVRTYLVEAYGASSAAAYSDARRRAARAAELGTGVRYVRTTFLPEEETLLHVFEVGSAAELRRAVEEAALVYDRIVEAIEARGAA